MTNLIICSEVLDKSRGGGGGSKMCVFYQGVNLIDKVYSFTVLQFTVLQFLQFLRFYSFTVELHCIACFVPVSPVLVIPFPIVMTLQVKIVWFDCQVAVYVKKKHQNEIFGVGRFNSSTLTAYCKIS